MNLKKLLKKNVVIKKHENGYCDAYKDMAHGVDAFLKKCEDENKLYLNDNLIKKNVLDVTKYLKGIYRMINNHYINDKKTGASIKVEINNKSNDLGINCEYIKFDFDFTSATICIDIDSSLIYITITENQLNFEYNSKYLLLLCIYKNDIMNAVKEYFQVNNIDVQKCQGFNVSANKILNERTFE